MTTQQHQNPPSPEVVAQRFAALTDEGLSKTGPIHMINMIRFKEVAEYESDTRPNGGPMSGAEAYALYSQLAGPCVLAVGGATAWASPTSTVLLGPEAEVWDAVFAVRYPSRAAFLEMVTGSAYQAIAHHRSAAVADSRLILTEIESED